MKRLTRIFILACMVLLAVSCQRQTVDAHMLRAGLAQLPMTLDPRYATDAASMRVQEFIHRGLVRLDEHFEPRPDLAEGWEHPSRLRWRFRLRRGIRFHDGSMMDAADVVATLQAVLDPAMASPLRAGFAAIDHVEADGNDTVVIHLKYPDASLLTRLNIGILPASLAGLPQKARTTIGCGAFRLRRWQGNVLELTRMIQDGKGNARVIRFSAVKDPVTRVLKLVRGELDFVQNDLPPHLLPYIRQQKSLMIQTRPSTTFAYIGLNLRDSILDDVRVRRALALGLDRKKLKKALFSDLPELAETVLTTSHWATAKLQPQAYDPGEAERLLDAAGFPRRENAVRFRLNYRTSTDPTRLRLATAIASMWGKIGVEVSIESLEWGGFYARIKRGDFQVFSLSWVGITDPDIYRWILHSSMWPPKGANRGRYANAQADAWLDAAATADNQAVRKALYQKVQHKMHEDMVYIPLWHEPVIAVSGPRISGFRPSPDGSLLGLMTVRIRD
ncbi:MAG: ABC transporter substrate-binding protein [Mariprofundaceae bacterium]|nr:ABC transporter substrate-binding protein [Mariprofundaceae bacterium]